MLRRACSPEAYRAASAAIVDWISSAPRSEQASGTIDPRQAAWPP